MTNIPHEPSGELKSVIDTWKAQGRSDEQIHGVLNFVSSGVFQEWLAAHSPSTEEQVDLVQPYKSEKTVTTSSVSSEQYEPTFVSSDELPSTEAAVLDGKIEEATRWLKVFRAEKSKEFSHPDESYYCAQQNAAYIVSAVNSLNALKAQRAALESVTTDEGGNEEYGPDICRYSGCRKKRLLFRYYCARHRNEVNPPLPGERNEER